MKKSEKEELEQLRNEKMLLELQQLRAWKQSQALPGFPVKEELPKPPQYVPPEPPNNYDPSKMDNPVIRGIADNIFKQINTPVTPPPTPERKKQEEVGSDKIYIKEAALEVKKHLVRNNVLYYIGVGTPLLSLAGYLFNPFAGYIVAGSGVIAMSFFFITNKKEIARLTGKYGV